MRSWCRILNRRSNDSRCIQTKFYKMYLLIQHHSYLHFMYLISCWYTNIFVNALQDIADDFTCPLSCLNGFYVRQHYKAI